MTITLAQALLLGFFCGFAKCCMPYTPGAFMYNTVIFNAVIVGAVMGNMQQAMMIGATIQLIYLGVIAAGGNQPSDPCLAAYIAIPIAIASNLNTNAAIALAVPVALLGVQISNLVYLWNGFFAEKADTKAADGDTSGIFTWGVIIPGIIRWGVFGVLVFLALYFGSGTMKQILNSIPSWLSNGLTAMGACLPAVGFAIIANLIGKKKYIPFFLAGFFLVQYSKIGTMPLLLIGLFLVFLYLTFTKNEYLRSVDEEDDDEVNLSNQELVYDQTTGVLKFETPLVSEEGTVQLSFQCTYTDDTKTAVALNGMLREDMNMEGAQGLYVVGKLKAEKPIEAAE